MTTLLAGPGPIERRRRQLGAIAGIAGFLIPAASNAIIPIWRMPSTSASGSQVAAYVLDHHATFRAVLVLDTIGVTLWMVFGGAVWLRLRRASGTDTLATSLFGIAFAAMVTLLMTGFTIAFVLAYRAPDPTTARVLYDLAFALLAMSGMPAATALTAYAAVALTNTHLPRRTGHLAAIAAAAHVFLIVSLVTPSGLLSLEGPSITVVPAFLFAWILSTALTLRRPDWVSTTANSAT
jgi:hypothetical protein